MNPTHTEVKTTPNGRRVVRLRVTEAHPVIDTLKLSPETTRLVVEGLGLVLTSGLVVGELAEEHEGIPKGSACARYHGSEGYVMHAVDGPIGPATFPERSTIILPADVKVTNSDQDAADLPPLARDLDGSIDDADTRALTDGVTDPDTDAEELEEAKDRITHEIGVRIEAERNQLRAEVSTLKVDHERMKAERDAAVKALNARIAKDSKPTTGPIPEAFQPVPPPKAKPTKPASPKAIETAKAKLNAKHGKGAGRSKK